MTTFLTVFIFSFTTLSVAARSIVAAF